jgi:hypothetical protein
MERFYEPIMCPDRFFGGRRTPKCPSRSIGRQVHALFGIRLSGETMEAREPSDKVIAAKHGFAAIE